VLDLSLGRSDGFASIVGKGAAGGGQTNEFLQFKLDLICLPMNCGSFTIRSCRPLPHAKLSGTNPDIGTCHVNLSFNRLPVHPLSTGSLMGIPENPCLNPFCLLNSFTNLTWVSMFVILKLLRGSIAAIWPMGRKVYLLSIPIWG